MNRTLTVRALIALGMLLGAAAIPSAAGCGGGSSSTTGNQATCPPNSDAAQKRGFDLVQAECRNCHDSSLSGAARNGAPAGKDYDVQSVVTSTADAISNRMSSAAAPMPPDGKLPAGDIADIETWIDCGAKPF
jgi:cytochrome c5